MAYLYILYSVTLHRHYIGHTTQTPEERLEKHLAQHNGFTDKPEQIRGCGGGCLGRLKGDN